VKRWLIVASSVSLPPAALATRVPSFQGLWLFSRRVDLGILLLPVAFAALAAGVMTIEGGPGSLVPSYWGWATQYIFGNTTHVILTFLLLGARRDVLSATPGQSTVVVAGSIATFAVVGSFFYLCNLSYPQFADLAVAVGLVFSLHHSMSQTKGLWSLYNLRAGQQGRPPATPRERQAIQHFVAVGVLLAAIRVFFVAKDVRPHTPPFINLLPGEPAFLPHGVMYVLLALWGAYAVWALASLRPASGPANGPKTLYVALHFALIGLLLFSPAWGLATKGGVHGLEYFFLCGRMLQPAPGESSRLTRGLVWPAMGLAALPIFGVGFLSGPLASWLQLPRNEDTIALLMVLTNALVMTHYFADAFIYRFRIPEVRRVALRRLGFG
jgi:hypothetical protein